MTRKPWLVALAFAGVGCGSSGLGSPAVTPTTVVGVWDLASVDFATGQNAPASGVMSFQLAGDGTASLDSCVSPSYVGTTLVCPQQRVCAPATYTFDGTTLSIQQTGQTTTHGGAVTFGPGAMTITGSNLLGASVTASTFKVIATLPTDCAPI
jgi:hypothetical protein